MLRALQLDLAGLLMVALAGCHTTRMGQEMGFPTPQERGLR